MSSKRPLARALLLPSLFSGMFVLLLSGLISLFVVFGWLKHDSDGQSEAIMSVFSDEVSNDILTGAHGEAYRKCRRLSEEPFVTAVHLQTADGEVICDLHRQSLETGSRTFERAITFDDGGGADVAGKIRVSFSGKAMDAARVQILMTFLMALTALVLLQAILERVFSKKIATQFEPLFERLKVGDLSRLAGLLTCTDTTSIEEVSVLNKQVGTLASQLLTTQGQLFERERQTAMAEMAAQVAHDIKSPLAALEVLARDLSQIPEDRRVMVRSAVNRIADIANNLLLQNKVRQVGGSPSKVEPDEPISTQLIPSVVESIISEKRLQFRSRIGIEIEQESDSAYGLSADVQLAELKRVLSNLINNSVEAFQDTGRVTVSVAEDENGLSLSVQDDGSGIPPEILSKLTRRGETHGKKGGSGLGLYHARCSVERWGGRLLIETNVGVGTTVRIQLPSKPAPEWFASRVQIPQGGTVVILDDDSAIHQVWRARLEPLRDDGAFDIQHFSTPDELRSWISENGSYRSSVYLVDFELLGFNATGLDLIEELGIGKASTLVTSRYEEEGIRRRCAGLGVRLIPKSMSSLVPVSVPDSVIAPDACLIDDDPLVHMMWLSSAKRHGKRLAVYSSPDEFRTGADEVDRSIPIYVDSRLGDGVKGEVFAKELSALGYSQIYLATGYNSSQFSPMPWIKGVLGKDPVWDAAEASAW